MGTTGTWGCEAPGLGFHLGFKLWGAVGMQPRCHGEGHLPPPSPNSHLSLHPPPSRCPIGSIWVRNTPKYSREELLHGCLAKMPVAQPPYPGQVLGDGGGGRGVTRDPNYS